ncbi:MAG: DUF3127 domain-containing protein [Pirellulaceae bacterium]
MSDGKVKGVVHFIDQTKTFGQKGFRKRLVVLEQNTGGRFPNFVPVDFTQDGCDKVDQLHVGDEVEVEFRLSGRKWQRDADSEVKFFLNAEATNYRLLAGKTPVNENAINEQFAQAEPEDDDVPF